ncbi:class I SAM-dependent methyltransferase [Sabulicella glaciei]|uniref:Class I SAM-dependent methyltransferase n=1 Tax=Sabulicella glaciei TaxID=2984948 RepID=A0ABT3NZS7_9PROT|nr:class I SAM-dependent methyltransferase [Roseococcus sp. MDT2-1-1]MCW8087659.1 class I SAM-dependent methyltransferase [Roseococcus sp. MDT2-1-1]
MAECGVDSVAYYDRNAKRFAADTGSLDMAALHERFLRHVPKGGRILDAGCGVGRDSVAFVERGFTVLAFDASAEMVRLAKQWVAGRAEVLQMRFEDVAWREEFDGIWACASLLHVPKAEFSAVAKRLASALRPWGALYLSFKLGKGEREIAGRHFVNHTEETMGAALHGTSLALTEIWTTGDVRPGRSGERWINAIAKRTCVVSSPVSVQAVVP